MSRRLALHDLRTQLAADEREVLALRIGAALSCREVAARMNRTEQSVRRLQRNGLTKLSMSLRQPSAGLAPDAVDKTDT